MRAEALTRVLRMVSALRHPRRLEDLAGLFQVTERTVRRDLETLQRVGIRVWRDEKHHTYRLSRPEQRVCELLAFDSEIR